jgi:hypothetical protein
MGLLSALSYNSLLRSSLENSLIPVRAGRLALSRSLSGPATGPNADRAASLLHESGEKALYDFRNQMQNAMLMQDEAAIWTRRVGERMAAIGKATVADLTQTH